MNERERLSELDGLRGWAALGVFAWHALDVFDPVCVGTHAGEGTTSPLLSVLQKLPLGFAFNGMFAVYVFFALSGYVLTHQLYAGNLFHRCHELIARRWLRLFPVVAVGSAVGFVVLRFRWFRLSEVAAINGVTKPDVYQELVWNGLTVWDWLIQTFGRVWTAPHSDTLYNRVLWTIGVEFQCSVLVFATVTLFRRVRTRWVTHLVTGYAGVCLVGPAYLPFLLGVILAEWKQHLAHRIPSPALGWLALLAACWCGSIHPDSRFDWWLPFGSRLPESLRSDHAVKVTYAIGSGLLLFAILTLPSLRAVLQTRVSRFIGFVSYPLYAVHQPLLYSFGATVFLVTHSTIGYRAAAILATAVTLAVCIGLSAIVARYVDAPTNRWTKSWISRLMNCAVVVGPESQRIAKPSPDHQVPELPTSTPGKSR